MPGQVSTRTSPRRPLREASSKPALSRPGVEARPTFATPTRLPRPLEPILVPKLRIHFADFPYLHCSIDQRLFTLETGCGYGYDTVPDSNMPPWGFQGPTTGLGTLREPQSFAEFTPLHPFSGRTPSRLPASLQRKENSSPARRQRPSDRTRYRTWEWEPLPWSRQLCSGILTGFPFAHSGDEYSFEKSPAFRNGVRL